MYKVNSTDERHGSPEGAEQRKLEDKRQSGKRSSENVRIHDAGEEQSERGQEPDWREMVRLAQQGDTDAMEQMVKNNIGLIHMVLVRMGSMAANSNNCFDREDLFQVGAVGLVSAIRRFDLRTEYSFSTYAVPVIIGEIRRFLRDDGMVHVGRRIKENAHIIARCREQITKENYREPSIQEISSVTGLSQDEIILALGAALNVESIHRPLGCGDDADKQTLEEILEDENNTDSRMIDRITVQTLIEELPEREGRLIRLRYLDGRTQGETAQILGMSQVSVSRLEKKILVKLRERMR